MGLGAAVRSRGLVLGGAVDGIEAVVERFWKLERVCGRNRFRV